MNTILRLRYWLEIIALPVFIFLVIHLTGHGISALLGEDAHHHEHAEEVHMEEIHEEHHSFIEEQIEHFFTVEMLSGILLLILFAWIWHRPSFKRWVPCSHDHCHHEAKFSHLLATLALCIHFFPEAGVRYALLQNLSDGEITTIIGAVGFGAHFLVDVIVAVLISSYWKGLSKFSLSMGVIAFCWFAALWVGHHIWEFIPEVGEGILFLISGFLLAMFIHVPHKPLTECHHCE